MWIRYVSVLEIRHVFIIKIVVTSMVWQSHIKERSKILLPLLEVMEMEDFPVQKHRSKAYIRRKFPAM